MEGRCWGMPQETEPRHCTRHLPKPSHLVEALSVEEGQGDEIMVLSTSRSRLALIIIIITIITIPHPLPPPPMSSQNLKLDFPCIQTTRNAIWTLPQSGKDRHLA